MDVISWRTSLVLDLDIVNELLSVVNPITPEYDNKLQHLKEQIIQKIHQPINKDNKKIIIFTAFADTADYLYQQLSGDLLARFGIHSAKITGSIIFQRLKRNLTVSTLMICKGY